MRHLCLALLLVGCGATAEVPRANLCRAPLGTISPRARVVLVTVDGVRWQEIFGGTDAARHAGVPVPARALLPQLYALADRGALLGGPGMDPFVASGPNYVSLPGYRELASGHPSHDCHDNECDPIGEPTLLDELRTAGLGPEQVAAIGSWEKLDRAVAADAGTLAVSVGRSHGASRDRLRVSPTAGAILDAGAGAAAWPGDADYRPDRFTAALALEYARVVRPRFLWVALGDTDEHAHHGDYERYLESLRAFDVFLGELARTIDDDTLVLITTDHGRAANFRDHGRASESRASWLVAAGPGIRHGELPLHRLADLAPLARRALGLAADTIASR